MFSALSAFTVRAGTTPANWATTTDTAVNPAISLFVNFMPNVIIKYKSWQMYLTVSPHSNEKSLRIFWMIASESHT